MLNEVEGALPQPTAYHVLVKVDSVETKSAGGIILEYGNSKNLQASQESGTLVALGRSAWKMVDDGEPWAKIGDKVYFARYEGKQFFHDKQDYRIMADNTLIAVTPAEELN